MQAPYEVAHFTATGGTEYSSTGFLKTIMLGVPRLADAIYVGNRVEVKKTVTLPTNYCSIVSVWGDGLTTTGYRFEGDYCYGEGLCEIVPGSQTATTVTLRTYVFELYDILGQLVGYYPRSPEYVTFGYSVLGNTPFSISGSDNFLCNPSNQYSILNAPPNADIEWTVSPSASASLTPTSGTQTTVTLSGASTSGTITLQATITSPSGCNAVVTKTIGINYNTINSVTVGNAFHYDPNIGPIHFTATWQPSTIIPSEIDWYDGATNQLLQVNSGYVNHYDCSYSCPNSRSTFSKCVYAVVKTVCNTVQSNYSGGTYTCSTGAWNPNSLIGCSSLIIGKEGNGGNSDETYLKVYPNPSITSVTISLKSSTEDNLSKIVDASVTSIKEIRIIDKVGLVKRIHKFSNGSNKQTISVLGLPTDVYTAMVFDGTKWTSTKAMVLQ